MAFLTVNGFTVPLAAGSFDEGERDLGGAGAYRAWLGTGRRERRTIKRTFRGETAPLVHADALAVEHLAMGDGDGWPFDGDYYSARGRVPSTLDGCALIPSAAADGLAVADRKIGGSVQIDPATTNALPAGVRDGSGAFGASFFTLDPTDTGTTETGYRFDGASCAKVVTTSIVNGIRGGLRTATFAAAAVAAYSGSVWIMIPLALATMRVRVGNVTAGTFGTPVLVTPGPAGTWTRVSGVPSPAFAPGDLLALYVDTASADVATTFYADAFQLEPLAYSTAWTGAASRLAGALQYAAPFDSRDEVTLAFWAKRGDLSIARTLAFARFPRGAAVDVGLWARTPGGGSSDLSVALYSQPLGVSATAAGALASSAWTHVAIVLRRAPASGLPNVQVFVNGTLAASSALPGVELDLDFRTFGPLHLGAFYGIEQFNGELDEAHVLPWAAPAGQIAALAAATRTYAVQPRAIAGGDWLAEDRVFEGQEVVSSYSAHARDGAWQSSGRTVRLALEEA